VTVVSRDYDGLARDHDRDERAALFKRIGENGEKRLRLLAGWVSGSARACSGGWCPYVQPPLARAVKPSFWPAFIFPATFAGPDLAAAFLRRLSPRFARHAVHRKG